MKQNRIWFVLAGLILGIGFNFLFVTDNPNLSITVWFVLALTLGFGLAIGRGEKIPAVSWLVGVLTLVFAAYPAVRTEPMTRTIGIMLAFFGLVLLAGTLLKKEWVKFPLLDLIVNFFISIAAAIANPFAMLIKGKNTEGENRGKGSKGAIGGFLRGVVIAVPILLVLTALLASADMVFAQRLKEVSDWLVPDNFEEFIFRLALILMVGYFTMGMLVHAVRAEGGVLNHEQKPVEFKPFLGWIETVIVLAGVALLFGFFTLIQFQYLFGGEANIHEAGYTYSQYAVKGFSELILVAFLTLVIVLVLGRISKRANFTRETVYQVLIGLNLAFVLVMVASAWMRLQLYLQAYGFTRLRSYTLLLIPWVAALVLGTLLLEVRGQGRKFAMLALVCLAGFGLTFGFFNIDGFVVEKNFERVALTHKLDTRYLNELSADAIYPIWEGMQSVKLDTDTKQKLEIALACKQGELKEQSTNWRQFNWSVWNAQDLLDMDLPGSYAKQNGHPAILLDGKVHDCYPVFLED